MSISVKLFTRRANSKNPRIWETKTLPFTSSYLDVLSDLTKRFNCWSPGAGFEELTP
jgi:hypothetical protein